MAVCSFLGHREIYDTEIDSALQNTIDGIVRENGETDFLLYPCNAFYERCFLAVLKAKARQPENITITLVLPAEKYMAGETCGVPAAYIVDRIICPEEHAKSDSDFGDKKTIRWMIRQSTHLVSCVYKTLYEPVNHILDYAQSRESLHIVDISDMNTVQAILTGTVDMTDRERYIFEKSNEGSSLNEIAEIIGISPSRIRQVLNHGCRAVRRSLQKRYSHMSAENQKERKSICSIFSLGEVTYETLKAFGRIIIFLIYRCRITHFEISADIQHSGFMYVLARYTEPEQILYNSEPVQNDIITDMIDRADFCICNLSDAPADSEIQEYILQTRRVVFIDMNRALLD